MFGYELELSWSIIAPELPLKTSMRSGKRGNSFRFLFCFLLPSSWFVAHLDLLLKILLDRMWSDVLSRWPLSVLSLIWLKTISKPLMQWAPNSGAVSLDSIKTRRFALISFPSQLTCTPPTHTRRHTYKPALRDREVPRPLPLHSPTLPSWQVSDCMRGQFVLRCSQGPVFALDASE